jgi:hypothetical protein
MFHSGGYEEPPVFTLIPWSAYSTLKVEAKYSSEIYAGLQRTTWCYIPVDFTLMIMKFQVSKWGKFLAWLNSCGLLKEYSEV